MNTPTDASFCNLANIELIEMSFLEAGFICNAIGKSMGGGGNQIRATICNSAWKLCALRVFILCVDEKSRNSVITVQIWFEIIRFRKDFSVCVLVALESASIFWNILFSEFSSRK